LRTDSHDESGAPIDLPLRQGAPDVEPAQLRETLHEADAASAPSSGSRGFAIGMLVLGLLAGFGAGFVVGQRLSVPAPPRAFEVPRPAPIETVPPVHMALPPPVAPVQNVPEPAIVDTPVVIEEPEVTPPAPKPAPRAVARPAPPAVKAATIRFDSRPPGATIYLDEVRLGVTPLTIDTVTPGTHQVRLEMLGHDTWRTSVDVKEGEQYFLGASLD